jgi:hypothetical protein
VDIVMRWQTTVEDRACAAILAALVLGLFLLTPDYARVDPSFAASPPPCEYHCR